MLRSFIICSSVLLVMVLGPNSNADEQFPLYGTVKKSQVNVRAGANTNYEIIDQLPQQAPLVLVGKSFEWYKVQLSGAAKCYVRADYIKEISKTSGEVSGNRVNVRAKADTNSSVLGQLVQGDSVVLIQKSKDWWQIQPPAKAYGWIHQDFVEVGGKAVIETKPKLPQQVPASKPAAVIPARSFEVSVFGTLSAAVNPPAADVHYALFIKGRQVYFLKDAAGLSKFKNTKVQIDGVIVPSAASAPTGAAEVCPVLKVSKISVIL